MAVKKIKQNTGKKSAQNSDTVKIPTTGGNQLFIKHPWITEKSHALSQSGKYVFLVDKSANKPEIKKAIKIIYKVDPIGVNIVNIKGKTKRMGQKFGEKSGYKKAIVELKEGQKIDVMPT